MTDTELEAAVLRLQTGDPAAFDAVYDACALTALRTAYLITRDRSAAEDTVQEAFVQVIRHVAALRNPASFRPWFYRIVVNVARRLARTGHRPLPLDADAHDAPDRSAPTPEEVAIRAGEIAALRLAIAELPEAHRVPLILRYFTGLSEQEIGETLGLPPGTVKSRLHAARKALQRRLEAAAGTRTPEGPSPPAHAGNIIQGDLASPEQRDDRMPQSKEVTGP